MRAPRTTMARRRREWSAPVMRRRTAMVRGRREWSAPVMRRRTSKRRRRSMMPMMLSMMTMLSVSLFTFNW